MPAGQSVQLDAPADAVVPLAQIAQEVAAAAEEKRPAGQSLQVDWAVWG